MKTLAAVTILVAAGLAGCAGDAPGYDPSDPNALRGDLLESGSTFVLPLAQKWAEAFSAQHPGVKISPNGGGSGKGKTDITARLVDIGGSDSTMNDTAIAAAGGDILHLPVAAGAVVIAYNLPGGPDNLKFDADTIAKIFMGEITKWNDPALALLNPGVVLPAKEMAVVHRSDGSGTTDTFTDYLSKADPEWKAQVGKGSTVKWPCEQVQPACTGAAGNNGVGQQVKTIPYTITYLGGEWADITAVQTGLIKNAAGEFVGPTSANVAAALTRAVTSGAFDDKLRGSVVNQDCADCYPIAAVSWFLVHQEQPDLQKGRALAAFLWFVLHEGQELNADLKYNAIPAAVVEKAEVFVNSMTHNGQKLR